MVCLAVSGVKPSHASFPDDPLTYILSPLAAETQPILINNRLPSMSNNNILLVIKCFFIISPPYHLF
jgi:hypothetical protein